MAARKGTILSDEHILKECAHYRPIPMKLAAKMIDGNKLNVQSPFTSKKLKYQRQLSRPEHFDSYAHSLSRNLGNDPEFRGRLHTAYTTDIAQHHNDNVNLPDVEMNEALNDPHLAMMYMARLFDLFEPNHIPEPPAPAANEEPEEDDDVEEIPPLSDSEDEGPPPLEEIPELEEENENEPVPEGNEEPGRSLQLPGNKKMRVRETQFLPKTLPKANVSGMKLRSGTQLQGPSPKLRQPKYAQFPTTQLRPFSDPFNIGAKDPFDTPVRTSDIEHTFKKRMALFDFEQQRLAAAKQQRPNSTDTHSGYFL